MGFNTSGISNIFHGDYLVLTDKLVFYGDGYKVIAEKSSVSDGTTNKGIFFIPKFDEFIRAAIIHDVLVDKDDPVMVIPEVGEPYYPDWYECADIYKEALIACGKSNIRAYVRSTGVKVYGWYINK